MRAFAAGVGVILVVIAAGFVAQRLFGSDSDHPISEAQESIEALPYRVSVREPSEGVLVGTADGRFGAVVHFAVSESAPDEPSDIPPRLIHVDENASRAGDFTVWEDSEARRPGESSPEWRERIEIAVAIEDAL